MDFQTLNDRPDIILEEAALMGYLLTWEQVDVLEARLTEREILDPVQLEAAIVGLGLKKAS